jgi:hypothetical protein
VLSREKLMLLQKSISKVINGDSHTVGFCVEQGNHQNW